MAAAIVADNAAAAAPVLVLLAAHGWDVNAATLLGAVDASAKHNGGLKKAVLKGVLRSLNYPRGAASRPRTSPISKPCSWRRSSLQGALLLLLLLLLRQRPRIAMMMRWLRGSDDYEGGAQAREL